MPDRTAIAVWALTAPAAETARRLARAWPEARLFLPRRLAGDGPEAQGFERFGTAFTIEYQRFRGHVCIMAAGVVVRSLAPLLAHKTSDPAVVVLDPAGRFAVSLVGGHLGGANRLARRAAAALGGQAVITTATDAAGLPSLELLAAERGWPVENLPALAAVSRELVEGRVVGVYDPGGWLLPELEGRWPGSFAAVEDQGAALVWLHWRSAAPARSLIIRPPALALGVGCNRGTGPGELADLVERTLAETDLSPACLAALASVEAKRDEAAILELGARLGIDIIFYQAADLAGVAVPNPSDTVAKHMGSASVCEAAAILASGGGRLLAPKHKSKNATAALALAAASG